MMAILVGILVIIGAALILGALVHLVLFNRLYFCLLYCPL